MRVVVAGQRSFGAAVAARLAEEHHVAGVCAPWESSGRPDRLRAWADRAGVPVVEQLAPGALPRAVDVIVAAHSHTFVGRRTRAAARVASVGYHPSLLPLHRGRDAVRWTIRDGDRVAGGSVYHLTDAVDGGPLAAQDYVLVPPGSTPATLWHDLLFPLGVGLLARALADMAAGVIVSVPQDESCATWEPSWERAPLHRPELPELTARSSSVRWTADPQALRRAGAA